MSKLESPLAKQLEKEMDPQYRRKQINYTNAIRAIELGWTIASKTFSSVQAKDVTTYARILSKNIKEDLDKETEELYGQTKTA